MRCLLDTGAGRSYIARRLLLELRESMPQAVRSLQQPFKVGQPDSTTHLSQLVVQDELNLQGVKFSLSMFDFPLEGHGLDIIIGAHDQKHHKVVLDLAAGTITLKRRKGREVILPDHCREFQLPPSDQVAAIAPLRLTWGLKAEEGSSQSGLAALTDSADPSNPVAQMALSEFPDSFKEPTSLPPSRPEDHSIPLQPGTQPIHVKQFRLSPAEREEINRQVTALKDAGVIRDSDSPYSAPLLLVRKKSGEMRLCVDFRRLNAATVKDKYPLPNIRDLLDLLRGKRYFTSLDLRSGYHQLRIKAEDIHKTAFSTPSGHFEYVVMPFGLTNAPAAFQKLMDRVLRPYLNKFVVVYLDDILIFSETLEEHITHVRQVLKRLKVTLSQA